ncbi:MAG: hypothetical protein ACXWW8_07310 [Solirubrobacterales bacterium]
MPASRGQASVELVAALPAVLLAGLLCLQLLAAGYTLTLADGAAEAGALAVAAGRPAAPAARDALPGWARDRVSVKAGAEAVDVDLLPPAVVPGLDDRLVVSSTASVRVRSGG